MPKYLVVYYTRTGHTEQVAKAVAEQLGADLEPIREATNRQGAWNYWRAGFESLLGKLPEIKPLAKDPADYDVVILGSPVWSSRPSTPMRAFLAANRQKLKTIACFCTLGGMGANKTLARMAEAAGKSPVATFFATEPELKSGAWRAGAEKFAGEIGQG